MTLNEFIDKYNKVKESTKGHVREIALEAGIDMPHILLYSEDW